MDDVDTLEIRRGELARLMGLPAQITAMQRSQEKMQAQLSSMETALATQGVHTSDLLAKVFGNGRAGIADRMTVLEQMVGTVQKSQAECPARVAAQQDSRRQRTTLVLMACSVLVAVGSLATAIVAVRAG